MTTMLEFERPIAELESKIEELRRVAGDGDINITEEVSRLETKSDRLLHQIYGRLDAWQKVQVARHPERPHCSDYLAALFEDMTPLAGDRLFAEDQAIIGGLARFRGYSVVVIGQEKGRDTDSRVRHNFGMARPEGYRKAKRLLTLADRFRLPVITLVDTAGAYPGVGAEERGQAEAIAQSIAKCLEIRVPLIAVIIGEGGSGGAIALAAGNHVIMLEHAVYSVISPEGCASILWRDSAHIAEAAKALNLTAQDLLRLDLIDEVVPEPLGGAHRDAEETISRVGQSLERVLRELASLEGGVLRARRREKVMALGRNGLA